MSFVDIVRIEFLRLARAPGVWIATIGFAAILVAGIAIPYLIVAESDAEMGSAFLLGPAVDLVLPIVVILVTYGAVAGHRDRGSIHIFLAAPVDRSTIVSGLLFARIALVALVTLVGLVLGILAIFVIYGIPPLQRVTGFVIITVIAAIAYTCIGVGASAAFARPIQSLATLIGGFVIARSLWAPLVRGLYVLRSDAPSDADLPLFVEHTILLSPVESYARLADGVLPPSPHLDIAIDGSEATAEASQLVGGDIAGSELAVALAILVLWAIGTVVVGLYRFRHAEIE